MDKLAHFNYTIFILCPATHWRKRIDKDVPKDKEKEDKKLSDEPGAENVIGKEIEKDYVSYHKIHKDNDGKELLA